MKAGSKSQEAGQLSFLSPSSAVSTSDFLSSQRSALSSQHCLVSIVVPTYKRPDLLDRCLGALCNQTLDAAQYEIIIVDDAPGGEAGSVVERWAERGRPRVVYLLVTDRHGPAAARNIGWRAAQGEIIAFTDDDCIPAPDWLTAGLRCFEDEGVAGAWGRIVVPLPPVPTDYEKSVAGLERAPLATANCFYRRRVLEEVGGFDERFTRAWREDSDLQFAILERGYGCLAQPEAVVIHPVRPAPWGVSLRLQRNSVFNALLFKKHPVLYREHIQEGPPWHYYRAVLSLVAALLAGLMGWGVAAVAASCVWLGSTAAFCRRRLKGTSRRISHLAEMVVTSALIPPLAVFWRLYGAVKYRVAFL